MTYQEALEIITNTVQCNDYTEEKDIALSIVQKALGKQIPKKPLEQECDFFDFRLVCPECKNSIVNVWNSRDYKPNYCHYCGQRLDWSGNATD